jgi:hypothetical protein
MSPALTLSATEVDTFDFVELTVTPSRRPEGNPFEGVHLSATFISPSAAPVTVHGFCDAPDGSVYRLRFMPQIPGSYAYTLRFSGAGEPLVTSGSVVAHPSSRKGIVRVDPDYPYHFKYSGSGEHYFWNGTTAYWLLGFNSDEQIKAILHRLAEYKVNRIRVTLNGRHEDGMRWNEKYIKPSADFRLAVCPWVCERPDSILDPGIDPSRFDVAFWQRYERMLRLARELDIVVDVIFYTDGQDPGTDPFGGKANPGTHPLEHAYYLYAVHRLAAFCNVCWNVTNEYHLFRTVNATNRLGRLLRLHDPYQHLLSVHGHGEFPFRAEPWPTHALYQSWDDHGGHAFMLQKREQQARAGRIIPQVNEEYGYEDHYAIGWGENRAAPSRNADSRRRLAWGMYFAGGYQTTGERADTGTGAGNDTGGGWVNGRGDASMTMLAGYAHIRTFFEAFEWWKTVPADSLVTGHAWCLAEPDRQYAIYLHSGGIAVIRLPERPFTVRAFSPRTGEWKTLIENQVLKRDNYAGPGWVSPYYPPGEDWAFLITAT